jgi:hypothetical protein
MTFLCFFSGCQPKNLKLSCPPKNTKIITIKKMTMSLSVRTDVTLTIAKSFIQMRFYSRNSIRGHTVGNIYRPVRQLSALERLKTAFHHSRRRLQSFFYEAHTYYRLPQLCPQGLSLIISDFQSTFP